MTQFIAGALDDASQVDVIYTDLSRAFDRIDHNILIDRLRLFGLSESLISLFASYLDSRKQFVEIRGFKSAVYDAPSGVPQGSILGPLLFDMFIDPISKILNTFFLIYADDIKIFSRISCVTDCENIQRDLDSLEMWCSTNGLSLNASKCYVMSYTRKKNPVLFNYIIQDCYLTRPDTVRDLGVVFDSSLSFRNHYESISNTAYKCLGFIIRNSCNYSSSNTLMLLYQALVRSRLEYASVVWAPTYSIHKSTLESIQRKFLKFLSFFLDGVYPHIGYPQDDLLKRFSLSSLESRRQCNLLLFLYKLISYTFDCPDILGELNFYVPRLESRNPNSFYQAAARTRLLESSPVHHMCEVYSVMRDSLDVFCCSTNDIKLLFT